ncbi:uncharacterized protein LOC121372316 [Gigantopelta aegis]|uniref:uncharacterized protein LOC121372316 n=1 Tax=Gigantopelta aegis TaxID=1735272 RepID=UPI001B88A5AA|nr:uncharacterized protein LOC121372316 [Gigantopelta aegis]
MGIIDSFMGASTLTKVAFIVLLLAQICSWIAFTVSAWAKVYITVNTYSYYGLWRVCGNAQSNAVSPCSPVDGTGLEWYGATQAFAIFGFVGINVAFLIVVLQMFTDKCKSVSDLTIVNAIICFTAAVCYLLAVIIFAVSIDKYYWKPDFGSSFGLAIVAVILAAVAGVVIILDKKGGGGTSPA